VPARSSWLGCQPVLVEVVVGYQPGEWRDPKPKRGAGVTPKSATWLKGEAVGCQPVGSRVPADPVGLWRGGVDPGAQNYR
jgi:hypothetical protein